VEEVIREVLESFLAAIIAERFVAVQSSLRWFGKERVAKVFRGVVEQTRE